MPSRVEAKWAKFFFYVRAEADKGASFLRENYP